MIKRNLLAICFIILSSVTVFAQQMTLTMPSTIYPTVTFANLPSVSTVPVGAIYNTSDVGVNGCLWRNNGTKWGLFNGSCVIAQNNMPWIYLSSGSVAADGSISGITALAIIHPKAWCYFPANALATTIVAGWYYCTFSSTTDGTAFLTQPGTTYPLVWPTSPTAVTDGKGSFTSANGVGETATISIPANVMGINGRLDAEVWATGDTGSGTPKIYLSFDGSDNSSGLTTTTNSGVVKAFFTYANSGSVTSGQWTEADIINAATSNANRKVGVTNWGSAHTAGVLMQPNGATNNVEVWSVLYCIYNDGQ
ncbi:MAG: hypothetical protein KGL39_23915 [Patescibacteria group bacterium]|nr:hypothetical protein [Patescibacteria group bacterium]